MNELFSNAESRSVRSLKSVDHLPLVAVRVHHTTGASSQGNARLVEFDGREARLMMPLHPQNGSRFELTLPMRSDAEMLTVAGASIRCEYHPGALGLHEVTVRLIDFIDPAHVHLPSLPTAHPPALPTAHPPALPTDALGVPAVPPAG
ncbi:MAG: hypothetical protein AAF288_02225 [Planctomycetota bacterium]